MGLGDLDCSFALKVGRGLFDLTIGVVSTVSGRVSTGPVGKKPGLGALAVAGSVMKAGFRTSTAVGSSAEEAGRVILGIGGCGMGCVAGGTVGYDGAIATDCV